MLNHQAVRSVALAPIVMLGAMLGAASPAFAAWELDSERSAVQFMSVKNASVAELHHFKSITGSVSDEGAAQVVIDLDSVETLIPIRNERMRELLFDTVRFPAATISTQVPEGLETMAAGETADVTLAVNIDLHGVMAPADAQARVTRLADGSLRVVLREPLLIKAADFQLDGGIEVLREVAGLANISTAVPVSATLVFSPEA